MCVRVCVCAYGLLNTALNLRVSEQHIEMADSSNNKLGVVY